VITRLDKTIDRKNMFMDSRQSIGILLFDHLKGVRGNSSCEGVR